MMSYLPCFECLFLSCQQQQNTENWAAVMSLRFFLFCDNISFFCKFSVFARDKRRVVFMWSIALHWGGLTVILGGAI